MNRCILCGKESFSSEDNVCKRCIDDFIKIDTSTLPKWLLEVEQMRSYDIVYSVVAKRWKISFSSLFRILQNASQ